MRRIRAATILSLASGEETHGFVIDETPADYEVVVKSNQGIKMCNFNKKSMHDPDNKLLLHIHHG